MRLFTNLPQRTECGLVDRWFSEWFSVGFCGSKIGTDAENLKSARLNPALLKEKIDKELALGRFAGPFETPPLKTLKISPVGLVPKSDGNYRLITHYRIHRAPV